MDEANTQSGELQPRMEIVLDMLSQMLEAGPSLKRLSDASGVNYITMSAIKNRRNESISNKTFTRIEALYEKFKRGDSEWAEISAEKSRAKKQKATAEPVVKPGPAAKRSAKKAAAPSTPPGFALDFQLPTVTDAQIAALEEEIRIKKMQLEYLLAIREIQRKFHSA